MQGFYRVSTKDQNVGGVALKKGDRVFADVGAANLNVCGQISEPFDALDLTLCVCNIGQGVLSTFQYRYLTIEICLCLR
jgi:hypothetical protein